MACGLFDPCPPECRTPLSGLRGPTGLGLCPKSVFTRLCWPLKTSAITPGCPGTGSLGQDVPPGIAGMARAQENTIQCPFYESRGDAKRNTFLTVFFEGRAKARRQMGRHAREGAI